MRALLFVACLLVGALARPDVGYSNNGLLRGLPQNAQQVKPYVHQQLPTEHRFSSFDAPQNKYLMPLVIPPTSTLKAAEDLQQLDPSVAKIEDISQLSQHFPLLYEEDSYNMAYQHSANSHESSGYAYSPETTVHKHIYVHVPPKGFEDEDVITTRVRHQAAPKQKHFKIVFIKAPTAPSIRRPVVPPPAQNEEKTLIYVLHKKPEPDQDIVIPAVAPTKPSKPEVYFIKYKTKKEEAPVYGPPPPIQQQQQQQEQESIFFDMEPRRVETPSSELDVPSADDFSAAPASSESTLTTAQSEEVSQPQQLIGGDVPSEVHGVPSKSSAIVPKKPQRTMPALSNQYLAPKAPQTMAPIVVEDANTPTSKYGPPNRFFLKKKK